MGERAVDLAEALAAIREHEAYSNMMRLASTRYVDIVEAEYDRRGEALAVLRELVELEYDSPRVRGHKTWRRAYVLVRAAIPAPATAEPGGESNDDPDASTAERRLPSPMLEPTSFDDTETEDELVPAPARPADPAGPDLVVAEALSEHLTQCALEYLGDDLDHGWQPPEHARYYVDPDCEDEVRLIGPDRRRYGVDVSVIVYPLEVPDER